MSRGSDGVSERQDIRIEPDRLQSSKPEAQAEDGSGLGPEAALDPNRLIALLSQQCDLYERLRDLAERQGGMITGDRPDMLLTVLQERQTIVQALTRLNEQLGPYRRSWEIVYGDLKTPQKQQAGDLVKRINDLLGGILKTDDRDRATLAARKQAVANELSGLSGGRLANAGYATVRTAGDAGAADLTG